MTHLSIRTVSLFTLLVAAATMLLAAGSAQAAILPGAEANGELANSNVTPPMRSAALTKMHKQGVRIVRVNWGWNEVATGATCSTQSPKALENFNNACYNWTSLDDMVKQTQQRRMQLLISFSRVPSWANGSSDVHNMGTGKRLTRLISLFAAFYKAAGERYDRGSEFGTINYWTIHNESNSPDYWRPRPNPSHYALLFARAAVALKAAHPHAQIGVGPTNPTGGNARRGGIKPVAFIRMAQPRIMQYLPGRTLAMKKRYVNAWAHNPYPGYAVQPSVLQATPHRDQITMATIDRLFRQLDSHAITRGTRVWATEFGWETSGNLRTTTARQAQFIAEAFDYLSSKRRVTIGISYGLTDPRDARDWQSGTFDVNGRIKPSFKMFQRMVSVPQAGIRNRVRRGTTVRVWGMANVSPRTGVLAYNIPGRNCAPRRAWCTVPRQRRAGDGAITASMRIMTPRIRFSVYSAGIPALKIASGYGMTRDFRTY